MAGSLNLHQGSAFIVPKIQSRVQARYMILSASIAAGYVWTLTGLPPTLAKLAEIQPR